jgi:hypothetical protein
MLEIKQNYFLCLFCLFILNGCGGSGGGEDAIQNQTESLASTDSEVTEENSQTRNIPKNFSYSTHSTIMLSIQVNSVNGEFLANTGIKVFLPFNQTLLLETQTNSNGWYQSDIFVPSHINSLDVHVNAMGIINEASVKIINDTAHHIFQ